MKYFFFEKNLEDIIRFSGDASTPVSPHLHALLSVCDEFHRRIFGMTSE